MINVEMRGDILQDTAQTMKTLSRIFHLKTSLICSSEEVTRQVSVTVLCFSCQACEMQYFHCNTRYDLSIMCCINLGNANVYANGRMRYQRRERRERQRDVSVMLLLLELWQTADV